MSSSKPTIPLDPGQLSEDDRQAYLAALFSAGAIPEIRTSLASQMQATSYDQRIQERLAALVRETDGQISWQDARDRLLQDLRQGTHGMALPHDLVSASALTVRKQLAAVATIQQNKP